MRKFTDKGLGPVILAVAIALLFCLSAHANLLPPRISHYSSASLTTAIEEEAKTFRVDQASLDIQCKEDCELEAVYAITSLQSKQVILAFVLPTKVNVQVSVNHEIVPTSTASELNNGDHRLQQKGSILPIDLIMLAPRHRPRLFYAVFKATLSPGSNIILVKYAQPYNHDVIKYKNGAGYLDAIRQLRYELWPLRDWHLSDTFTMTVQAEFSVSVPKADELMVQYFEGPHPFSPVIERFISPTQTVVFQKEWKHEFPGRIVWFLGDKETLEVANGFIKAQ